MVSADSGLLHGTSLDSRLVLYPRYDFNGYPYGTVNPMSSKPLMSGVGPYLDYFSGQLIVGKYCRPVGIAVDEVYDLVSLISSNPLIRWIKDHQEDVVDVRFLTSHLKSFTVSVTPTHPNGLSGTWACEVIPFTRERTKKEIASERRLKFPFEISEGRFSMVRSSSEPIKFSYVTTEADYCGRFRRLDDPIFRLRISYLSLRHINEEETGHIPPPEDFGMPDPDWNRFMVEVDTKIVVGPSTIEWNRFTLFRRKYRINLQAGILINHIVSDDNQIPPVRKVPIFPSQVYSVARNGTKYRFRIDSRWHPDFVSIVFTGYIATNPAFVNDDWLPVNSED